MSYSFFNTPTSDDLDVMPRASEKAVATGAPKYDNLEDDRSPQIEVRFQTIECNRDFLDLLGTHFLICNDKIKGKGEDSGLEAYTSEAGIIGVFDGCGGLGAKTCPGISGSTEAYLASRTVCSAVRSWFYSSATSGCDWNTDQLKDLIVSRLGVCQRCSGENGFGLKGSMVRPFPSTIATVTFRIVNTKLVTEHVWAGDSRSYVLDKFGLAQISVDDIKGEDAMSNLTRDGALTNVISVDKRFVLHHTIFAPKHPCLVLCATDGCFGYVSTPMEFEHMLLSSLIKANNAVEWKQRLNDDIFERSGDDQTIAIAAFGFDEYDELKLYYQDRYEVISRIVRKIELADQDKRQSIWEAYKPNYYRHIANKE